MLPPCILNLTSFTACVLSLQACSEGVVNNLPRNSAGVFRIWLAAVQFRFEATESLPRLRVWKLLRTLLELELFACVVIVLRHIVEPFRSSTAERERCCSTSDIFSERVVSTWTLCSSLDIFSSRVTSSWTLMFNADRQLDVHREFREASTEAAGSYRLIWSGRIVSSGLDCCTRTRRQNSSSRYFSSLVVEVRVCRSTSEDRSSSLTTHTRTVVRECFKGDEASQ